MVGQVAALGNVAEFQLVGSVRQAYEWYQEMVPFILELYGYKLLYFAPLESEFFSSVQFKCLRYGRGLFSEIELIYK